MKVLLNASMYTKNPTGVGVYTREIWNKLCERLEAKNVAHACYVYDTDDLRNPDRLATVRLPAGLETLLRPFISFHRLIWNLFCLPRIARDYDLVYSFSSHGSPFIKNQIITIHDLVCLRFPKQHKFQYLYFRYIMPFVMRASEKIVVISEFTKTEVLKHYKVDPDKIVVVLSGGDHLQSPNGSLMSGEENKIAEDIGGKSFFLTVGASYPHKNVERIIEAINQMPVKISLVVIGEANNYYRKLRKSLNKESAGNVIFLEYVSPSFLNVLYRKCIANIYISFNEGFGFPPFEAAVNNKVSIASNSGALPEIYRDAVCYVDPDNVDDLTRMLTRVASPDFNHCDYQKKFPALISKYQWSNTVDKVAGLIYKKEVLQP